MRKQTERPQTSAVYTRYIAHSEQSSYIEIPFEMPERIEEVHVRYAVEPHGGEDAKAVIDLGVRDSTRVRGWSGGARKEFRISREKATPGYLPGALEPGNWAVLHNAYQIPEEGCTVTVEVTFSHNAPRWLKGDLHTHSVHSDGKYTLEENAAMMESLGCDFIAMTDHNTSSQNIAYPRQTEVLMIPGTEFTTNFGHANFIGVTDPMDDFRVSDMNGVREKFRIARERGARIVLNHPHCDHCPWEWDFAVDHDWVEVWNGPWRAANERAVAWWQEQLASGRRLVAVGGSDVHRPDPYVRHAMPCVWVKAEELSTDGILEGIDRGRVVITYAPDGPFVTMQCGDCGVGDAVPVDYSGRETLLQFEDLLACDLIRVYSERGLEMEAEASLEGKLELTVSGEERLFLRAEVWRHFELAGGLAMAAMTNPIYFEPRNP